ncbi:MFS transporter [Nocardia australiensis]|uniref:MFS transporter n=1 Tax=Nocardia australiensis TaxID=2887191 RepID=UPI001D15C7F2|nr:MFS transporter [Nocardia australiensis]
MSETDTIGPPEAGDTNDRRETIRVAAASLVGSALEWYDFYLYGTAAALVFNRIIFVNANPAVATMAAFATFAVGYFIRPLGGLIFGRLGDVVGRKNVLIITLLVMGTSTALMAFIPTYAQVGIWSPIILIILRAIQGIGAGAEFGGAAILSVEHANPRARGLQGAWPAVGVYLGLLMASATFALITQLPQEQFLAWGWRIPFAASVVVIAVAVFIRLRLSESPAFLEAKEEEEKKAIPVAPLKDVFRFEWKSMVTLIGMQTPQNVVAYINLTFIAAYLTGTLKLANTIGPVAVAVATGTTMVTLPLFGALSDRIGRKPVILFGIGFSAVFVYPYFWIIDNTRSTLGVTLAVVASVGIGVGAMFGPQGAYFSELFTSRSRFTGLAFSREVASALSGGLTPLIAVALVAAASGSPRLVALYVIAACAIGFLATLVGPETRGRSLRTTSRTELEKSSGSFTD